MHTEGGGGKMEPKRPVEEDVVEEESLGPKRWSNFMVDEEEPPACFLLFAMVVWLDGEGFIIYQQT